MALMMITMACLSTAFAEEHDIRIHTFAVPIKNKVNVRREPAGSIRGTIDKEDSVYILDTTVKRNKIWCCVIVLDEGIPRNCRKCVLFCLCISNHLW